MSRHLFLLLIALALPACAYVTAEPVQPGSSVSGIRIYDVKPLLVVAPSNVTVVMVPNYNRAYALRFGSFLAKHDFTADLQNGMLSHLVSNQDGTVVPVAILNAISEAAKAAGSLGKAFAGDASTGGGKLQVYDIVFDAAGNLTALRPLLAATSLIDVPLAPTYVGMVPTPVATADKPTQAPAATTPAATGTAASTTPLPGGQTGARPTQPVGKK